VLRAVPGVPYFYRADVGSSVTVVSVSKNAGPNTPAFRYAGAALAVAPVQVDANTSLPGASFTVQAGRKRLGMAAPFLTSSSTGEFFFYEAWLDTDPGTLHLLGSVLADDPRLSITIEGV
jgi:hypothetical protein